MRATPLILALGAAWTSGCTEAHDDPSRESWACDVAGSIRSKALDEAAQDTPRCQLDSDCVVLVADVRCEPVVYLGDCGTVVHREVAARYAAKDVDMQVCEAVAGAAIGCSQLVSCVAQGAPLCAAGECVAGALATAARR